MAMPEERLTQWLRDAHAAEVQAEIMLTGIAERLQHYPKLKARVKKHISETKRQAHLVRSCIKRSFVLANQYGVFALIILQSGKTGTRAASGRFQMNTRAVGSTIQMTYTLWGEHPAIGVLFPSDTDGQPVAA